MIKFEGVAKEFGGEPILEEISFKINKGERCGLVGRNGSGKTTLLRLITGEEHPDGGVIEMPKGYTIGYLTQHLTFTSHTLIEEASKDLSSEDLYKIEKILFGLGFKDDDLTKDPLSFSGGYQLRIHLAKVLVQEPDCLLLDEPTNYLDIVSIRWITRFLQRWTGELILISHDHDFMDRVTTHTLGIHRKRLMKYKGGTVKYYAQLLESEKVHEQTRLNLEKKRAHMEEFITRLGGKASKAAQAQSRKKALARMPVLEELAKLHHLDFSFPYAPFPSQRLLDVSNVSFGYGQEILIPDFSLAIDKGDRIAIVGKNGRGKSTLLRILGGDLQPKSGKIKMSPNVKVGFFGQSNIERLHPKMTIEEEIASASPDLTLSQVRTICGIMMFSGDRAKKPIEVLSGGEKSRVLLGKILGSSCNLLLLDEPTNHLDMESIEALMAAMEAFEGSIIIVSHSEMILRDLPTKFVICHQGNQHLFVGDYDQFLEKEGWEEPEEKREEKKPKPNRKETQKEIRALEKEIMRIEEEVSQASSQIVSATEKGEFEGIAALTASVEQGKRQIDALFIELEKASQRLHE